MAVLELVLLLVLIIPILAVLTDSPLGRALARRLEGPKAPPPELTELADRLEVLSGEVDELTRTVETLKEENLFFQRLLEEGGGRHPEPPRKPS